jgi:hypothetical protein
VKLVINSQVENGRTDDMLGHDSLDGNCAVQEPPFVPGMSCGVDLSQALIIEPELDSDSDVDAQPAVEFGQPLQDWFEMALKSEAPKPAPVRNSWGEDEEDAEDDLPGEEGEDEDQDPFEDFDEDDFDDDFDDDFEEELDDEYEIEPADDGLVPGAVEDLEDEDLDEEVDPNADL